LKLTTDGGIRGRPPSLSEVGSWMRRLRYTLPVEGRPGQSAGVCVCAQHPHPSIRPSVHAHHIASRHRICGSGLFDPNPSGCPHEHGTQCTAKPATMPPSMYVSSCRSCFFLRPSGSLALWPSGSLALWPSGCPVLRPCRPPPKSFGPRPRASAGSWTGTTKKTLDGRLPAHIADIRVSGRTRWDSGSAPCSSPRSRYSACFSSNP
jgi:hypothetical protein